MAGGSREIVDGLEDGYYFQPTVITNLGSRTRVVQEEIFVPVVTVISFKEEDEVIEMASSTAERGSEENEGQ